MQVQISYFDDASSAGFELSGGNDVSLLVTVPEPASAMVLLAGLGASPALDAFAVVTDRVINEKPSSVVGTASALPFKQGTGRTLGRNVMGRNAFVAFSAFYACELLRNVTLAVAAGQQLGYMRKATE